MVSRRVGHHGSVCAQEHKVRSIRKAARGCSGVVVLLLATFTLSVWGCFAETTLHEVSSSHRPVLHAVHAQLLAKKMDKLNKVYRKVHQLPIRLVRARESVRPLGHGSLKGHPADKTPATQHIL